VFITDIYKYMRKKKSICLPEQLSLISDNYYNNEKYINKIDNIARREKKMSERVSFESKITER